MPMQPPQGAAPIMAQPVQPVQVVPQQQYAYGAPMDNVPQQK